MHRDGLGPQALREGPKAQVSTAKCSGVWVTPKTKSLKSGLLLIQTLAACRVFGEQTLESEGKQAQRLTENKTQLGPKQEHINGPVLGPEARMEEGTRTGPDRQVLGAGLKSRCPEPLPQVSEAKLLSLHFHFIYLFFLVSIFVFF